MQYGCLDLHDVDVPGDEFKFTRLGIPISRCPGNAFENKFPIAGENPEILMTTREGLAEA